MTPAGGRYPGVTIGSLGRPGGWGYRACVDDAARLLLAQSISVAALIAGTIEYAQLVERRRASRRRAVDRRASEESGLRALVRVTLLDDR